MTRPLKVFLSHAHADADAVRALYDRLVADGVDAWLDKEKLIPGQDWEREIRKAVREADVVIVCLSKQFNQRGYRQKEVHIALNEADMMPEGEIFIIPARLEECENLDSLRKWHWVDLFEKGGYEKLLRSLQFRAKKVGAELVPKKKLITGAFRRPIVKRQSNPEKAEQHKPKQGKPQAKEKKNLPPLTNIDASLRKKILRYAPFFLFVAIAFFVAFTIPSWYSKAKLIFASSPTQIKEVIPTSTEEIVVEPSATSTPLKTPLPSLIPSKTSAATITLTPEFSIGSSFSRSPDNMVMSYIPAGVFLMGNEDGDANENYLHDVYLDAYWVDQTEVTNSMYMKCMDAGACNDGWVTKSQSITYPNHPAQASWDMALGYCTWVDARLLTEAEWEKAARGGLEGKLYPWGDESPTCKENEINGAQFGACSHGTKEVRSFSPNGYELYDMSGNLSEWVSDWYSGTYYQVSPKNNPQGPISGPYHVTRGGRGDMMVGEYTLYPGTDSWELRISNRRGANDSWYNFIGFRCAKDAP